jgi:hypothetical protein
MRIALQPSTKAASLLIRLGLAFAFLYAAISSFQNPQSWLGFLPDWLTEASPISPEAMLHAMSVVEIFLALWLLSGKLVKYAGLASALLTASIVAVDLNQLLITFRDIPIITASLALVFLDGDPAKPKKRSKNSPNA